jgi:hypothetical protein
VGSGPQYAKTGFAQREVHGDTRGKASFSFRSLKTVHQHFKISGFSSVPDVRSVDPVLATQALGGR